MRLLHHLGDALAVWPFDGGPPGQSMLVEIYCRAFIRMGGARGLKLRTMANLNAVLARLGSAPAAGAAYSDHETDVLAAADGLRHAAADAPSRQPRGRAEGRGG